VFLVFEKLMHIEACLLKFFFMQFMSKVHAPMSKFHLLSSYEQVSEKSYSSLGFALKSIRLSNQFYLHLQKVFILFE
jgi:hypothetical protein